MPTPTVQTRQKTDEDEPRLGEEDRRAYHRCVGGRLLLVNGFGDCIWCHDEAHRTQHHHSHEERFSRSRRTLTTSRGFSLSGVHCGAASITAL